MPTDLTKIDIKKIDSNLFEGTPDRLADNLGYTYQFTTNLEGLNYIELTTPVTTFYSGDLNQITAYEVRDNKIKYLQCKLVETGHGEGLIQSHRFAIRITGDPDSYNDDKHWQTSLMGGVYANETLEPLVSQNTFDIYGHQYQAAYNAIEAKEIKFYSENNQSTTTQEVGYRYNLHVPRYQQHIEDLEEAQLPNIYFNELYSLSAETTSPAYSLGERPYIESFVSCNDPDYRDVHASKGSQRTESPPPYDITRTDRGTDGSGDGYYFDKSLYLRQYLTGTFINSAPSASAMANVVNKSQNIYFTSGAVKDLFERIYEGQEDSMIDRYPMYNRVVIPHIDPIDRIYFGNQSSADSFTQIIAENNLQEEVMQYINNTFDTSMVENIEFVTQTDKLVTLQGNVVNSIEANTKSNVVVDLPRMLLNIANANILAESDDEMFLTPKTDEAVAMINDAGALRYYKSINGIKALEETIALLNRPEHQPYSIVNGDVPYNTDQSVNFANILSALRGSTDSRQPEMLAYKIEKFVGSPVGENASSRKLQTYMFFNTPDLDPAGSNEFVFHDTQVKYGQQYSYVVKAYAIIQGYNYEYSNLKISRQIGDVFYRDSDGNIVDIPFDDEKYCLEFFDPVSKEASEQLLNEETNLLSSTFTADTLDNTDLELIIRALAVGDFSKLLRYAGNLSPAGLAYTEKLLHDHPDGPSGGYDATTDFHSGIVLDTLMEAGHISLPDPATYIEVVGSIVQGYFETWAVEQKSHYLRLDWYDESTAVVPLGQGTESGAQIWLGDYSDLNQYATNAQIKAANKYLADLYFDIEPSVKIIEIPIMAKTVTISDHPPVACDVVPYQRKDNSNIVGFYINKEAFTDFGSVQFRDTNSKLGLYPTPMMPFDEQIKTMYLSSNNLIESEIIKNKSVSHLASINVYRTDFRPTSIEDFADHYITQVKLSYGEEDKFGLTNGFYEERIAANQKYYYLFKFINANGDGGYISPIQCVELVDDGGYKYATFDLLFENDLPVPPEKQSSKQFKKLMQVSLNSRHTQIHYEDADFDESAENSLNLVKVGPSNSEESVWDKKFKFRLTSKKTGKKIDLNVTYKLRTD